MPFLGYTALLLCWMYCTAERACEQSPPKRAKEVPTETRNNPPYPHGTQIIYTCQPGYIKLGRIVIECADGVWKQRGKAECRNKPCGHPGDTEFGSFQLTAGNEFVFGARVEYRCNDGYRMLSQKNYRECLADGWSNDIPHCEVAKCLPVKEPENGRIVMSGAFELNQEYSFGQVVEFECNANYRLVGSKVIHCSSEGKWDSDVPQCQVITCDVPTILNGIVRSSKKSYRDSERLSFACNEGYKYGEGADVRCTESGWYPTPYCTEITCSPPTIRNGNFRPQKGSYRNGAIITVDCDDGYRFNALTGRNIAKCTSNGWVPAPGCVEKPCDFPVIENGRLDSSSARQYFPMRVGQYVHYECLRGYTTPGGNQWATIACSARGWDPEPKCLKKPCDFPVIENGRLDSSSARQYFPMRVGQYVHYECLRGYTTPGGNQWATIVCSARGWDPEPKCLKICSVRHPENGRFKDIWNNFYTEGEKAIYSCNTQYRPENDGGEITCTKNGWSPAPRCVLKEKCQNVDLDNGFFIQKQATFELWKTTTYRCNDGFVTPEKKETGEIRCNKNGWSPPPKCIRSCKTSHIPNLNDHVRGTIYLPGDALEYPCPESYRTANNTPTGTTWCDVNGEWNPEPQCLAIECEMSKLLDGRVHPRKGKYRNGDVVRFSCTNNFVRVGPASAQCYYFGWFPSPPTCKANPRGCGLPPEIPNGNIAGHSLEQYQHGNRREYECDIEFKLVGSKEIECVDGQWSSPPSCIEDRTPCGSPSSIFNVVLHQQDQTQFSHGHEVTYECKQGSGNTSRRKTKCFNGEWKPLPLCDDSFHQCVPPEDAVFEYVESTPREVKETGMRIQYKCTSTDRKFKQATCVSGKWSPEIDCTGESTCPSPPQLPGAEEIPIGSNFKNMSKITFSCLEGFQLIGANEIMCLNGKWQSPPYCVEIPCLPPQPVEYADLGLVTQNLKMEREGKTFYLPRAILKVACHSGFELKGPSEITCSRGNWSLAPTCLETPCGSIPKVANAAPEGRNKEKYEPGETIHYQCNEGFQAVGLPEIICRAGNWSTPPVCEDVSCGAPPQIPSAYIASTQQQRYLPGARVEYECESDLQIAGVNYVTCLDGQWSEAPTCEDMTCEPPPEIAGGKIEGTKKSKYLPGETAEYRCWQDYQMTGASTVKCQNGNWTQLPKCKGESGKCGPPPDIENGDILSFPRQEYSEGATLKYKCPSLYVLEGSPEIRCTGGRWTNPPVCLVACTASEEDMNKNNIQLKWLEGKKLYSKAGDIIEFVCKSGHIRDPESSVFRVPCINGTLEYPLCIPRYSRTNG